MRTDDGLGNISGDTCEWFLDPSDPSGSCRKGDPDCPEKNGNGGKGGGAGGCKGTLFLGVCLPSLKKFIPSVCSKGGFGYFGREFEIGKYGSAEAVAVVGWDSKEGGAHGVVIAGGIGPLSGGYEFSRTWSDWKEHRTPIVFVGGDKHIHGIGGKKFDGQGQYGALGQYDPVNHMLTLGGYGGGAKDTFAGGLGGYVVLSWNNCQEAQ